MILALVVGAVWAVGRVLQTLSPVLWPIAVAGILAYLLDPLVDAFERRKVTRARAIFLVFIIAVSLALGVVGSVVPQLIRETRELAERVPTYAARLQHQMEGWVNHPPAVLRKFFDTPAAATNTPPAAATNAPAEVPAPAADASPASALPETVTASAADAPFDWGSLLGGERVKSATEWLARALGRVTRWLFGKFSVVASFFGVIAGLALVPVYAFYLLLEKRGIQSNWTEYLPLGDSSLKDEIVFVIRSINDYLIVFFRGQVLVAMCDGVLYTIGFLIIGLPYALLLGAIAVPLTMIPFLGAIVTCLGALIIALVQYGDWLHPLLVLGVFAIVQSLEGLVIQPKIIGDRVGLHPLTIIIAVMAGTTLFGGLLGGILAIPLTAALRVLMFRYVWKRPQTAPA